MKRTKGILPILRIAAPVLTVLFAAFIFWNSSQSGSVSGSRSSGVLAQIQAALAALGIPFPMTEHILRKSAHFLEYFALGILLTASVRLHTAQWLPRLLLPAFLGLLVPVCDEFLQTFIPGRSGQVSDVLLDFAGVVTGILLSLLVILLLERRRRKKQELVLWKS